MFLCLWLGCLLVVEFVVLLVDYCGFACRVIYVVCSVVVFAFCIVFVCWVVGVCFSFAGLWLLGVLCIAAGFGLLVCVFVVVLFCFGLCLMRLIWLCQLLVV